MIVHFKENSPHTPRDSSVLLQNELDLVNKELSSFKDKAQNDQKIYDVNEYEKDANEETGNEENEIATEIEADAIKPLENWSYPKLNGILSQPRAGIFEYSRLLKKGDEKRSTKSYCSAKFERIQKEYEFTLTATMKLQEVMVVLQKKYKLLVKDIYRCQLGKAELGRKINNVKTRHRNAKQKAESC